MQGAAPQLHFFFPSFLFLGWAGRPALTGDAICGIGAP
nr:MAG TPA: Lhca1, Type II chlorophyll a/b, membrane complex, chlorophyll, light [Caudoviricetes sp.]